MFCFVKKHRHSWNKRDELESIDVLTDWIKSTTLRDQTKNYLKWSINKAWKYLFLNNTSNIILIILPATIPFVIGLRDIIFFWEYLVTLISFLSAILSASTTALKLKSLWQLFRKAAEQLKNECLQCSVGAGEYRDVDDIIKEEMFSEKVEEIHKEALILWKDSYLK